MLEWNNAVQGPVGDKGMPGPYCAATELELVAHLIAALEHADYYGDRSKFVDGGNPTTPVDCFVLLQVKDALKNYEALLRQPLCELVPPGFFHIERPPKTCKGLF